VVFIWRYRKLKYMILATHGFLASSIGQFDADAVAFFDRVTTAGGTLSTTEKNAVNTLVIQMKTDGIWTKMKAIYPMVGASAAACAQNLKSSSFTGTFTATGWTFASTGVTPNGTSAYMDTGFVPNTNFNSNNDISFGQYMRSLSPLGNNTGFMGSGDVSTFNNGVYMIVRFSDSNSYNRVASNTNPIPIQNTTSFTSGFYALTRENSTSFNWYKNSTLIYNTLNSSTGRTTNTFYANGAVNLGASTQYGGGECNFSFIGDALTSTQISNYYTAVQAFQTTLSRQV
jgi:hypothetical protein